MFVNNIELIGNTGFVVIGTTASSMDFPTTSGAFQTTFHGGWDVFISQFNSTGSLLTYSSFFWWER